jgi:hypothetical protein
MAIHTKHGIKWRDYFKSTDTLAGIIVRQTDKMDHQKRAGLFSMYPNRVRALRVHDWWFSLFPRSFKTNLAVQIRHYVDVGLLGSNAVWTCRIRRNILSPSLEIQVPTALLPRRQTSTSSPSWEPKISGLYFLCNPFQCTVNHIYI